MDQLQDQGQDGIVKVRDPDPDNLFEDKDHDQDGLLITTPATRSPPKTIPKARPAMSPEV